MKIPIFEKTTSINQQVELAKPQAYRAEASAQYRR